jgi:ribonuclease HI
MDLGHALVYWVDGSYAMHGVKAGLLGAGVVWLDGDDYLYRTYKLGYHTGNNEDAEVFAIAAALGRAKKEVAKNKEIRLVKVYSDSKGVLEGLARGNKVTYRMLLEPITNL